MPTATRKAPGGKLIHVSLNLDKHCIRSIKITGDFFLHPEEAILDLEKALHNIPLPIHDEDLKHRIDLGLTRTHLIGATPQDFYEVIKEALHATEGDHHA
jgi:lipoate-protein ligase A